MGVLLPAGCRQHAGAAQCLLLCSAFRALPPASGAPLSSVGAGQQGKTRNLISVALDQQEGVSTRETPDSITCHPSRSLVAGHHWSPCFCGCTCRSPAPRRCPQISAGRTRCSCRERQKHSSGAYRQQSCQLCSSTQLSPSLPAKPWSSPCSPWTHGFPDPRHRCWGFQGRTGFWRCSWPSVPLSPTYQRDAAALAARTARAPA